ncbi:MAG: efflux RND transporter periplasmic adaptor subunit [Terriglobales bacterium]
MRAHLLLALALGFAAAVGLAGCSETKPAEASAPATQTASAVQPAAPKDDAVLASGPLVVENQVDVAAQREGVVLRILAEPGLRVKKNQLLAELDARQVSADMEAARAKTRSIEDDLKNWEAEAKVLEADYQRAQKMWDAQLITKEQLDHARYKAESDQWDVKRVQELLANARLTQRSLELEVEKTRIRAPFDGIVARRYVRDGQKVAVGDRLFWVTAEGPLRVKFTLPERYLGKVKKGEELWLTTPDGEGEKHQARIIQFSPVVDPASGTIDVLAEVVGPAQELRPGMTANLRFEPGR